MNKKEIFIKLVDLAIGGMTTDPVVEGVMTEEHYNEAIAYFEAFKTSADKKEKPDFTDNGKLILTTMIENKTDRANMFTSKQIAECAFISSRSVSGSIRKLVTDGYVEKIGQDPIIYALTEKGMKVEINA